MSNYNSHRSVNSAYQDYVDGKPVEKHPRVCALLTGVFNQRPPQPCYIFVWDIEIVLVYFKINMLPVLMALSSGSRTSLLQHQNIKFMASNDISYKFYFHKLHKSWRRGKAPSTVSYQTYTQDPNLCVVKTLDEYISRTEVWRFGRSVLNFYYVLLIHINQ